MTNTIIHSGESSSGLTISGGDTLEVQDGGVVIGASIASDAVETVDAGGFDSGATVNGNQNVYGSSFDVIVDSGTQMVASGGIAQQTTLTDGTQFVGAGGLALGTVVDDGSGVDLVSGGVLSGAQLNSGGIAYVEFGGSASDVNVGSDAQMDVGGSAAANLVSYGGLETIESGGSDDGSTVEGTQIVGGIATDTTVRYVQIVASGGLTLSSYVSGFEDVEAGGTANATTLTEGGSLLVEQGGVASGVSVSGVETEVSVQGSASDLQVLNEAFAEVVSGGILQEAFVANEGTLLVDPFGSVTDLNVASGASAQINGTATLVAGDTVYHAAIGGGGVLLVTGAATIGSLINQGLVEIGPNVAQSGGSISGGLVEVAATGTLSGATLIDGTVLVTGGGVLLGGSGSGSEHVAVSSGGYTSGVMIGSGAAEDVSAMGSAGAVLVSGGTLTVENGGSASGVEMQGGEIYAYGDVTGLDMQDSASGEESGTIQLVSGNSVSALAVFGTLDVAAGSMLGSDISNAGLIEFQSGSVVSTNMIVGGGGVMLVDSGASVSGTIGFNGTLVLDNGSMVGAGLVVSGLEGGHGDVDMRSGASASFISSINQNFYVYAGAVLTSGLEVAADMNVYGGTAIGLSLTDDAALYVSGGGTVSGASISDGYAYLNDGVLTNVVAEDTYVSIYAGAQISGLQTSGNSHVAQYGGAVTGLEMSSSQYDSVYSGTQTGVSLTQTDLYVGYDGYGSAYVSDLTMSGAGAYVYSGTVSGATLNQTQVYVSGGPSAGGDSAILEDVLLTGGSLTMVNYSYASGVTIAGGASMYVEYGATAAALDVASGSLAIYEGFAGGVLVGGGGSLQVSYGDAVGVQMQDGVAEIDQGGGLELAAGAQSGVVSFGNSVDETLQIDGSGAQDTGLQIDGFVGGQMRIELAGIGLVADTADYTIGADDLVTFSGQDGTVTLDIAGASEGLNFFMEDDDGLVGVYLAEPAPAGLGLTAATDTGVIGDDLTADDSPVLSGTATPGASVEVYDGATVLGTTSVDPDGNWTFATSGLSDGTHLLSATVYGGQFAPSPFATLAVTIDTSTPDPVGAIALAPGSDTGAAGDFQTAVTDPVLTGSGMVGDVVSISNDGNVLGTAMVDANGNWSFGLSPLADGSYLLEVSESNAAGTASSVSGVVLTIDTTAPDAPSLGLAPSSDTGTLGDGVTTDTTPVLSGTAEAGSFVQVFNGSELLGNALVGNDGSWQLAVGTLLDGTYSLSAVSHDLAGNVSAPSGFELTISTGMPATPTIGETAGETDTAAPELVGTAPAGSTVVILDGADAIGSGIATTEGNYVIDLAGLSIGSHMLTAVATDQAGAVSAASAALTVIVSGDGSYTLSSANDDGGSTVRSYDATGQYVSVDTYSYDDLLTQEVTPETTLRNIYDQQGTLIGTVEGPGSSNGLPPHPGFDTTRLDLSANTATDQGSSVVTLLGESNVLTLTGNDTVNVAGGDATISAGAGDVVITGGTGSLSVFGGTGFASVTGGSGANVLIGGAGGGYLAGGSNGGNVLAASGGNTTLTGGGANDVMFGGDTGNTRMFGAGDNTLMIGGAGAVTMTGGDGTSEMFGGAGTAAMFGGAHGGDLMVTGHGATSVVMQGGDAAFGTDGDMLVSGSANGNDVMVGGSGLNQFTGGGGNTLFVATGGSSTVTGGAGQDTVWTGAGNMTATLGDGGGQVVLESGDASVTAGLGADVFDVLAGDGGGSANIFGFDAGQDSIALFGYGSDDVSEQLVGGSTVITLSDNTTITLMGVSSLPTPIFG